MSITIAGQPVLIDHDGFLEQWLDAYLRTCDHDNFFYPENWFASDASFLGNDSLFESTLPSLPPIRLGCLQWPAVGCCRFARGLFAVDRISLRGITEAAGWGTWQNTNPTIPPDEWTASVNNPLAVKVVSAADPVNDLVLRMYLLPPIQVSDDCWIIKLVDLRFTAQRDFGPMRLDPLLPHTWQELFRQNVGRYDVANLNNTASPLYTPPASWVLEPDYAFEIAQTVPDGLLYDAAIFTLGLRPLVPCRQPFVDFVRVIAQNITDANVTQQALIGPINLTGGSSAVTMRNRGFDVLTPRVTDFFNNGQKRYSSSGYAGAGGFPLRVRSTLIRHFTHLPDFTLEEYDPIPSATFMSNWEFQMQLWSETEHSVAFPGLVEIVPGGKDDYIEWDISENGPVTRVKSLPHTFVPVCIFPQHPRVSTPAFEQAWWYSTNNQTMAAIAMSDAEGGEYDEDLEAWALRTATVQLVDLRLALPSPTASQKLALAQVRAMVCRRASIKSGESLIVHNINQVIYRESPGVSPGDPPIRTIGVERGWVISETSSQTREAIFSCELVTTEEDTASPYNGVKYASGTVIWATEPDLIGTVIDAYDHWCILDLENAALEGIRMIASWGVKIGRAHV